MNIVSLSGVFSRMSHRLAQYARLLDMKRAVVSFGSTDDSIQRIYVINLDRKPDRWRQVSRELGRFRDRSGGPLSMLARRFSAIDARYLEEGSPKDEILRPHYSLADQLLVEPNPQLTVDANSRTRHIDMTRQEVAIALSHIDVWKLVASGDAAYTLVLEDDAYFRKGFARTLDEVWPPLVHQGLKSAAFDVLYLSFEEVGPKTSPVKPATSRVRRPDRGIWQASGYVLSRDGARKLLKLLPAHGPIDLWLNLQFGELDVFLTPRSIIEQRIDLASTNSYSVLPVLSQVGVLTREKPLVSRIELLFGPVIAFGEPGSGLTALATALSMLGYTCCSDILELPAEELSSLLEYRHSRVFNAYVNVGGLAEEALATLADKYPDARFISTNPECGPPLDLSSRRFLVFTADHQDKWAVLSAFLGQEYPAFPYPDNEDIGQRVPTARPGIRLASRPLKFDRSPWIIRRANWDGIAIRGDSRRQTQTEEVGFSGDIALDDSLWKLRDDTFPSNLVLFSPTNFTIGKGKLATLTLRKEHTPVRSFTSAALASRQLFRYGTFSATLRPSDVPGTITGMFLHRNGPRQEIDIEFLGKDTTSMLVNVYFNPGTEGTKLEYGYRGTPTLVDLGFDASKAVHLYEIEWLPHLIRWRVDGRIVHERVTWGPTPVPDLAMEFNINLWHSRSTELAGRLNPTMLPARAEVGSIRIVGQGYPVVTRP